MILNSTHTDRNNDELINSIVGSRFSFLKNIKLGGVGSKRMIIEEVSPNLQQYLNLIADINYANIELRPDGILVFINKGLKNYTWVIPYYKLHIYHNNGFSVHAEGKFIRFKNNKLLKENKSFLNKIIAFKAENNEKYKMPYDQF